MNPNYQVVIKGVEPGFSREAVAEQLASLFKISLDAADRMLDQKNLIVKKGVEFQAAVKYVGALELCGCSCEIQPEVDPSAENAAAPEPEPAALDSTHENINTLSDAATLAHQHSSASHNEQNTSNPPKVVQKSPLNSTTKKTFTPTSIAIGVAVMVAGVAAVAGYKTLFPKEPATLEVAQQLANGTREQEASTETETTDYASKLNTVAGEISMVDSALSLNGKIIYEQDEDLGTLAIQESFAFPEKTILLLQIGGMGSWCPAMFRFLTVKRNGQVSYTEAFGSCSDLATTSVDSSSVVINMPNMRGAGDEAWRYVNDTLSQIKHIDPNIEQNITHLESDKPIRVHGKVARYADGNGWNLELQEKVEVCNHITDQIDASWDGDANLMEKGESEFTGTVRCFGFGPSIHLATEQSPTAEQHGTPAEAAQQVETRRSPLCETLFARLDQSSAPVQLRQMQANAAGCGHYEP